MSTTTTRSGEFTYDDFCALVRDGEKGDLIDGVIYVASPENTEAAELFRWLISLMGIYARKKRLGRVLGSRVACRLDDSNSPEPDILFVSAKHRERIKRGRVDGAPDLAVEIVSPESVDRDYKKKRIQYEPFGITEYWIVDEDISKVTLLRLNRRGKYREVRPTKGMLFSKSLKGFWLDPNWLWQDPRPDELEILRQSLESGDGKK